MGSTVKRDVSRQFLVVDDSPAAIRVIGHALEDLGEVLIARNGLEALVVIQRSQPDVVIVDVDMPFMDGFELLHRLKNPELTGASRNAPAVILQTIYGDQANEVRALAEGAADFIRKPVDTSVVRERVLLQLSLRDQQRELLETQEKLIEQSHLVGCATQGATDEMHYAFREIQALAEHMANSRADNDETLRHQLAWIIATCGQQIRQIQLLNQAGLFPETPTAPPSPASQRLN